MKFLLALGVLLSAASSWAAPEKSDELTAFYGSPVVVGNQRLTFAQLRSRQEAVVLSLRQPLEGQTRVTVAAWGRENVLLLQDDSFEVKSGREIEPLHDGSALVPSQAPVLRVDDAVQVVPITSIGDNASVTARYTLQNTGQTPLDVSVDSTSCGCTSAKLDKNRLGPNESTTLVATMHADDERLVRVTLSTSDPAQPRLMVALQSKRVFTSFQPPSPLSLFGEKGQRTTDTTDVELPAGWKVGSIRTTPSWLETTLRSASPAGGAKTGDLVRYRLSVTVPDSAPEGTLQGQVRLDLKGAPLQFLSVPVNGFVSNDVAVSPRVVVLNDSPLGVARRVVVVHGPQPFSIRAVTSDMTGFQARFEPSIKAKAHAVELLVPVQGKKADPFFERVKVALSDGRTLPLDITGTVGEGQLPTLAQGITLNAPAPTFSGIDSNGKVVSSSDFKGRSNVLLTFFPHCFTGGCESHLSSLRDADRAIEVTGTRVVAVSTDDPSQVRAFAKQLHLPFPVLSDPSRKIALAFGAVQNTTEAPSRLSFLIDKSGKVRWIDTDVHVRTHGADVLAMIHQLRLTP